MAHEPTGEDFGGVSENVRHGEVALEDVPL
jgi:hypothetical protein